MNQYIVDLMYIINITINILYYSIEMRELISNVVRKFLNLFYFLILNGTSIQINKSNNTSSFHTTLTKKCSCSNSNHK